MKALRELLERRRVRQRFEIPLIAEILRDALDERPRHIRRRNRVHHRRRSLTAKRLDRRRIRHARRRQTLRRLKRHQRLLRLRARRAVNLADRKPRAIEQHLHEQAPLPDAPDLCVLPRERRRETPSRRTTSATATTTSHLVRAIGILAQESIAMMVPLRLREECAEKSRISSGNARESVGSGYPAWVARDLSALIRDSDRYGRCAARRRSRAATESRDRDRDRRSALAIRSPRIASGARFRQRQRGHRHAARLAERAQRLRRGWPGRHQRAHAFHRGRSKLPRIGRDHHRAAQSWQARGLALRPLPRGRLRLADAADCVAGIAASPASTDARRSRRSSAAGRSACGDPTGASSASGRTPAVRRARSRRAQSPRGDPVFPAAASSRRRTACDRVSPTVTVCSRSSRSA